MSSRYELAELVLTGFGPNEHGDFKLRPYRSADAVLAAGYRKTRVITTVEELDALPDNSVVLTVHGNSTQIMRDVKPDAKWWHWIITDGGPATVIHEPDAS